ncbi:hypothetical protein P376_1550 [Streptomyces sp. HCCB10043]|nr:hypothetical protein P376_1550 [Streptomyces sp. HCCB10043]
MFDGERGEFADLVVVDPAHRNRVDLDGCEAGRTGRAQSGQDVGEPVAPGDRGEPLGAQGVQADVDPAQPGVAQGGGAASQADAVGGEGQFGRIGQSVQTGDEPGQTAAQQRFAAGEPYLGDAETPGGHVDESDHLVVGEQFGPGQPVEALGGHAVRAAQIAAVGERDPQVGVDPAEPVRQRGRGRPVGERSGHGAAFFLCPGAVTLFSPADHFRGLPVRSQRGFLSHVIGAADRPRKIPPPPPQKPV